jgi:hypothetical protein
MHPTDHPGVPLTPTAHRPAALHATPSSTPARRDLCAELAANGILLDDRNDALAATRELLRTWDKVQHMRANEALLLLSPIIQRAKRDLLLADLRHFGGVEL